MRDSCLAVLVTMLALLNACGGDDKDDGQSDALCEGVSCSGHGTCFVNDGGFAECDCDDGYHNTDATPKQCIADQQTDACAGVTCSGHGTCVATNGSAACDCDNGYHRADANPTVCEQDAATFAGSCTISVGGFTSCIDYNGSSFTATAVQTACAAGNYSASPCTLTGAVGKCTLQGGTSLEAVTYYYYSAATNETACTAAGGVWQAL